jgi:hypothetical protein
MSPSASGVSQALHASPDGIPPTIFLQLDSTSKQNGAGFLIAFCELSVHLQDLQGDQDQLPAVGTHYEYQYDSSSAIAVLLRRSDALSLRDTSPASSLFFPVRGGHRRRHHLDVAGQHLSWLF